MRATSPNHICAPTMHAPTLHNNLNLHCIYYYSNMVQICKYWMRDISAIVNESFIFTIVLMSHIPYLLTHLINSKYIINEKSAPNI